MVHPLVWIRLKHRPYWPGKALDVTSDGLLVIFFGDFAPVSSELSAAEFHMDSSLEDLHPTFAKRFKSGSAEASPRRPFTNGTIGVDECFERAVIELERHVELIRTTHPTFRFPPPGTLFSKENADVYYGFVVVVVAKLIHCFVAS